jgi:acetyltransferase
MLHPAFARTQTLRLRDGEHVVMRIVRAADLEALQSYLRGLSSVSRYYRFFGPIAELPPREIDRLLHLDGVTQAALIACASADGAMQVVGEARYAIAPDGEAEFALSVAEDWRHRGLGSLLMADIERRVRTLGARLLQPDVLYANHAMRRLARKAGLMPAAVPNDARLIRIVKDLTMVPAALPREEQTQSALAKAA